MRRGGANLYRLYHADLARAPGRPDRILRRRDTNDTEPKHAIPKALPRDITPIHRALRVASSRPVIRSAPELQMGERRQLAVAASPDKQFERTGDQEVRMHEQRVAFSSAGAPGRMPDMKRWCEEYFESHGGVEIVGDWESPSAMDLRYLPLGAFALRVERADPIKQFNRHRDRIARDSDDHFTLIINRGTSATVRVTPSGSSTIAAGEAVLFDRSEVSAHICPGGGHRLVLILPRRPMCRALPNVEDLVGTIIPAGNEGLRLLTSYADGLLDHDDLANPVVLAHAGQSLMDLAVLVFSTDRDSIEAARLRGLRAARLQAVLRCIRAEYPDPGISPAAIARRVGISVRTLHGLLEETEASFSERVRELRLAKAFELLQVGRGSLRKITDAAYEAGFSDLSYFNHSFKRKYGITPTAARGRHEEKLTPQQPSARS